MTRKDFIAKGAQKGKKILEFGPLMYPAYPKREGYHTEIVDYTSKENLLKQYEKRPKELLSVIEDVDYQCSRHYAHYIQKENYYDIIMASHVIEHMIDLIEFLNDCSYLLKDDGVLKLIIPDKRFEYDYFREPTSLKMVIDEHLYFTQSSNHTLGTILENNFCNMHIKDFGAYAPNSAFLFNKTMKFCWDKEYDFQKYLHDLQEDYSQMEYQNSHAWCFTPKLFQLLIYQLNILGFINMSVDLISKTKNGIEFYVELRKNQLIWNEKIMKEFFIERKEEEMESFSYYLSIKSNGKQKKKMIFGIGKIAEKLGYLFKDSGISYNGYVVSNDYKKSTSFCGKPVYTLEEILTWKEDVCVYVGVSDEFMEEVCTLLERDNIEYVI